MLYFFSLRDGPAQRLLFECCFEQLDNVRAAHSARQIERGQALLWAIKSGKELGACSVVHVLTLLAKPTFSRPKDHVSKALTTSTFFVETATRSGVHSRCTRGDNDTFKPARGQTKGQRAFLAIKRIDVDVDAHASASSV